MRYLTGSWEAKALMSWLFSEFNCVTLGKSLNLSVILGKSLNFSGPYSPYGQKGDDNRPGTQEVFQDYES